MKDIRQKDFISIEFTEELLEEWTKIYFKKHPKAKKIPIETPANPSLNKWIILRRQSMNAMKQNYKDFGKFVVKHYGLDDLGISKCKCKYITYQKTLGRIDLDNTTPKFILDALTAEASGVICDDGVSCITELTLLSEYHKGINGARIEFYDCEYDKELLEATRIKEIGKSEKRQTTIDKNNAEKKAKKKTIKKK
jgi:hypothetical protein